MNKELGSNQKKIVYWVLGIILGVVLIYFLVSSLFSPGDSEAIAKSKLIGEWDWGKRGYFVITDNEIYLYKDSSKSKSNVFYGTYTAKDGIPAYADGTKDGMKVFSNYIGGFVDGEKFVMSTPEREYAFEPNSDGTYTITDVLSNATGVASKVK